MFCRFVAASTMRFLALSFNRLQVFQATLCRCFGNLPVHHLRVLRGVLTSETSGGLVSSTPSTAFASNTFPSSTNSSTLSESASATSESCKSWQEPGSLELVSAFCAVGVDVTDRTSHKPATCLEHGTVQCSPEGEIGAECPPPAQAQPI
jgi:hypothetical protein